MRKNCHQTGLFRSYVVISINYLLKAHKLALPKFEPYLSLFTYLHRQLFVTTYGNNL